MVIKGDIRRLDYSLYTLCLQVSSKISGYLGSLGMVLGFGSTRWEYEFALLGP